MLCNMLHGWWRGDGGGEEMRIAAGDDGNGREGEEMERPGGYRRGHAGRALGRAFAWQHLMIYGPLSQTHTSRHRRSARTRPDGWAAGRELRLNSNALVSLDGNIFAGLTSLK